MISAQPITLWGYLSFRQVNKPQNISKIFYLSWEDAVWDLLNKKNIKKGASILLPNFYCADVEKNMKLRGYKIVRYPLNNDLTVNNKIFIDKVVKIKPAVIVIFHPVGIRSNLFNNLSWMNGLNGSQIVIEDAVHITINPEDVKIYRKNHFIIDSLRKVVPVQGSNLYGRMNDLDFVPSKIFISRYSLKVYALWVLMTLFWSLKMFKPAEVLMIKGYDLIGDSLVPVRGLVLFEFLYRHINFAKLKDLKEKQANYYAEKLPKSLTQKIKIKETDKRELRGWPVVIDNKNAEKTLDYLRKNGVPVRFELSDSVWCRNRKIIYLPLGAHIKNADQIRIIDLMAKCNIISGDGKKQQFADRNI